MCGERMAQARRTGERTRWDGAGGRNERAQTVARKTQKLKSWAELFAELRAKRKEEDGRTESSIRRL